MKPKPPPIPPGYRLLKVGEARPNDYIWLPKNERFWKSGMIDFFGEIIRKDNVHYYGNTYAAPLPKKKSKTKRKP